MSSLLNLTFANNDTSAKNTAVQSEKGVSFSAIKNFHFEKNKKINFAVFWKHHICCIALNNLKFYMFIKSFIIYLMM